MEELTVCSLLAPEAVILYRALAGALARCLGARASFLSGSSAAILDGPNPPDVVFVCSPPYVRLRQAPKPAYELLAAPVLTDPSFGGRPEYRSEVVVSADSAFGSFEDLRGARWAYNEPDSWSGHWAVRYHLARLGETAGYFGEAVAAGFHGRALRLVAEARVDAAAIDCHVLALTLARRPEIGARLRVVASLETAPIQPVLVSTRLPVSVREALRAALLGAGSGLGEVMLDHGVDRFLPVADPDYDPIRTRLEAARSSPLVRP